MSKILSSTKYAPLRVLPLSTIKMIDEIIDASNEKRFNKKKIIVFNGGDNLAKATASSLISHFTGKKIVQVDLSKIVSKYIGETEKNLCLLFEKAEKKNFILFFDEADALFGKRSEVKDSHDKYANIEISYLLSKIESYSGLTILTTNMKVSISAAMKKRCGWIFEF